MDWRKRFGTWFGDFVEHAMPWLDTDTLHRKEARTEEARVRSIATRVEAEKQRSRAEATIRAYQRANRTMSGRQ